jgi:hypothetical protein
MMNMDANNEQLDRCIFVRTQSANTTYDALMTIS